MFKNFKNSFIFFLIFILFFPQFSFSQDASNYIVKIQDNKNGSCGTGFITTSGKLITANHIVLGCNKKDCSNLNLILKNSSLPFNNLTIEKQSFALDIAILNLDIENKDEIFKNAFNIDDENIILNEISPSDNIKIIGFPHCENMEDTNGNILFQGHIQSYTSTPSTYGNSGSVAVLDNGKLAGMAIKASSVNSALASLIIGGKFDTTILNASHIKNILDLPKENILEYEINALKKHYFENIMTNFSIDRINLTSHFMLMMNNLIINLPLENEKPDSFLKRILSSSLNAMLVLKNTEYPRPLLKIEEDAETLALIYNIEKNGFADEKYRKISVNELTKSFDTEFRSEEHKKELNDLFSYFEKNIGNNYIFSIIAKATILFLPLFLLILFNIFEMGYIFKALKGTKTFSRILKTLLFPLLLWPFAICVFNILEKKKKLKENKSK